MDKITTRLQRLSGWTTFTLVVLAGFISQRTVACNAEFTHSTVAGTPDNVHFSPVNTGGTSYWSFGDGSTSMDVDPWHAYAEPGTYYVCHHANQDNVECSWCDSVTVEGPAPCNAGFTHYATDAHPDSLHFSPAANATTSYWSFGDGTTSTNNDPWHHYAEPGTYYVCHHVSGNGTECSSCDSVTVEGSVVPCNAEFMHYAYPGVADSIHFYPTSTTGTSVWHFGDGAESANQDPWHAYAEPGTYYVCHTVTTAGTSCTFCDSITIDGTAPAPCDAGFTYTASANASNTVSFLPNGPSTTQYWNFGDGQTSTNHDPSHTYAEPGTYYVCHHVSGNGSECTWCDSVTVAGDSVPPCNAEFTHHTVTGAPTNVHFVPQANIGTSYWNFGDGTTSTNNDPWHAYAEPGTYYVCHHIAGGTECSWCDSVTVEGGSDPCNTHFGHYALDNQDSIHFYPTGTTGSAYHWTFGDGHVSNDAYPWHAYAEPGVYEVCLTVTHDGTECTWCDHITIAGSSAPCNADFSFYLTEGWDSLHFYATGSAGANIWHFGDGSISDNAHPWHVFEEPGTYYVCHTVTDAAGNSCSSCDSITIGEGANFFFFMAETGGNGNFEFDPSVEDGIATADQSRVAVYPNPADDHAVLEMQRRGGADLRIYDVNGKTVGVQRLENGTNQIVTKKMHNGVYYYMVMDNGRLVSKGQITVVH